MWSKIGGVIGLVAILALLVAVIQLMQSNESAKTQDSAAATQIAVLKKQLDVQSEMATLQADMAKSAPAATAAAVRMVELESTAVALATVQASVKPVSSLSWTYDSFDNSSYDGSFDKTKWGDEGEHKHYIAQQHGSVTAAHVVTTYTKTSLYALGYNEFMLSTPVFFEARIMLSPIEHAGNAQFNLAADDNSWWAECNITDSSDTQGWAACVDQTGSDEHIYPSEGRLVDYGTWHLFRMEIDPRTMTFSYFIDGDKVAGHIPVDAERLKRARFIFRVGIWGGTGGLTGYIDDVRIGPAQ
jgi:hypothetical protein